MKCAAKYIKSAAKYDNVMLNTQAKDFINMHCTYMYMWAHHKQRRN